MRQVYIDGHNAMQKLHIRGEDHRAKRKELLRMVRDLGNDPTVFFDARGAPPDVPDPVREDGVRVVYCRHGEADASMVEWVRDQKVPHRVTVVTNDREVAGRARNYGARASTIHKYFARFLGDAADEPEDVKPEGRGGWTAADFGLPDTIDLDRPEGL